MNNTKLNYSKTNFINNQIEDHIRATNLLKEKISEIESFSKIINNALLNNKKILTCGNGGSAADSIHLSSEIVGRYERERKGYPSISLASESSAITAIGNDYGFENIFSRQVEALGNPGDILVVISTSGDSQNLINASISAKRKDIKVIGLLGRDGGRLLNLVEENITIKSQRTCRIQEMHSLIIHIICELFERAETNN